MQNNYSMTVLDEHAIKPYFYLRNGDIHCRYTVDRCIELSKTEEERVKKELTANPSNKQNILFDNWNFFTIFVRKTIIWDGIARAGHLIEEYRKKNEGRKTQRHYI